ncbi:MAG: hypothetical protein MI919_15980, partial [Holophagales bacterium]|nr:hypothetical protein [Holophagales bacterium]
MNRCLIPICLLPLCALPLPAQPIPAGDEFQVNTLTTDYQESPDVAVAPGGDFMVVWKFESYVGVPIAEDPTKGILDDPGIRGQRYASDGTPLGGELQVNAYTTGRQVRPSIAATSGGGFVVVWDSSDSSGADTSSLSIQGQRYASDGTALGAQLEINSYTTGPQSNARVAVGPGDEFVVVWETDGASVGTDTDGRGISGRRFASDGTPIGGDFQVNTYTTGNQRLGGIGIGPGGEFTVVWDSFGSSGTDTDLASVQSRRFAPDGTPMGGQFQVNTYTTSSQFGSDLAVAPNGEIVVVWESFSPVPPDLDGRSLQGQRYGSDGSALGGEFVINSFTTSSQGRPSIAVDATGEFTVAWQSGASPGDDDRSQSIQFRRLDATGAPLGEDFQVNTYTTGPQLAPAVSAVDGNAFVVVWESDGSSGSDSSRTSVQARRFIATDPVLGLAKAAGPVADNGDGTFTVALSFVLENLGNVPIGNVQVLDDLAAALPGLDFSVATLSSPTLSIDPAFDGDGATALLDGTDVLGVGETASIRFELTFDPAADPGPFLNQATATAIGPAADPVSDLSDDGIDPDANGNGDPTEPGENDPTPIAYSELPVLGLAKAAGPVADNGDGTFSLDLTFTIENLGNVQLADLQITDDLAATFPGATITVTSSASPTLSVNPAFDGVLDTALLAGTDILAVGVAATLTTGLDIEPGADPGPFFNSAVATAESPASANPVDLSQDGPDPDPDDDGDPTNNDEPTEIRFPDTSSVVEIPTLGASWMLLLAALLAFAGMRSLHR